MPESVKCAFQFADLRTCQRWANRGSRFCHNHQPPYRMNDQQYDRVHPLARLSTPDDVFNVIRESLNATRQGRMAPAQAFAVDRLANTWLKFHDRVRASDRDKVLYQQMLPSLVDAESALDSARENHGMAEPVHSSVPGAVYQPTPPFPVQIDDFEVTSAPPVPRTSAEFKAWCDAMYAAKPESERIAQRQAVEEAIAAHRPPAAAHLGPTPISAPATPDVGAALRRPVPAATTKAAAPSQTTAQPPASASHSQAIAAPATPTSPSEISDLRSAIAPPSEISDLKSAIAPSSQISDLRCAIAPPAPLTTTSHPEPAQAGDGSAFPIPSEPLPAALPVEPPGPPLNSKPPDLPSVLSALATSSGAPLFRKKAKRNGRPSALDKALITAVIKQIFPTPLKDDS